MPEKINRRPDGGGIGCLYRHRLSVKYRQGKAVRVTMCCKL